MKNVLLMSFVLMLSLSLVSCGEEKKVSKATKVIQWMEADKDCIEKVENKEQAKECMIKSEKKSKSLGLDFDFKNVEKNIEWSDEIKKAKLSEIRKGIKAMKK